MAGVSALGWTIGFGATGTAVRSITTVTLLFEMLFEMFSVLASVQLMTANSNTLSGSSNAKESGANAAANSRDERRGTISSARRGAGTATFAAPRP